MTGSRLLAGRSILSRSILAAGLLLAGAGLKAGAAAERFPFDQDLLLSARFIGHSGRVPILNISDDGRAIIGLWCRTVRGRVQMSGDSIRIQPEPLSADLPRYREDGQCTPRRMQADTDMLAVLAQATGWRRHGDTVTLTGAQTLRFDLSDH